MTALQRVSLSRPTTTSTTRMLASSAYLPSPLQASTCCHEVSSTRGSVLKVIWLQCKYCKIFKNVVRSHLIRYSNMHKRNQNLRCKIKPCICTFYSYLERSRRGAWLASTPSSLFRVFRSPHPSFSFRIIEFNRKGIANESVVRSVMPPLFSLMFRPAEHIAPR